MNLSINKIGFNKINFKNSQPVFKANLVSKPDSAEFSKEAQEKREIKKELESLGIDSESVNKMVNDNYGTKYYKELVNGCKDEFGKRPGHDIATRKTNLTPAEAIVYLAYGMNDYYSQSFDTGSYLLHYEILDTEGHTVKEPDFSPLELVKKIEEGYDMCSAGLILKGELSDEEAQKVSKYLGTIEEIDKYDLESQEYTVKKLNKYINLLEKLTSNKKDKNGNYAFGLTRPLTTEEATILVDMGYKVDIDLINFYIEKNKDSSERKCSLYDVMDGIFEKDFLNYSHQKKLESRCEELNKQHDSNLTPHSVELIDEYGLSDFQIKKFIEFRQEEFQDEEGEDEAAYQASLQSEE